MKNVAVEMRNTRINSILETKIGKTVTSVKEGGIAKLREANDKISQIETASKTGIGQNLISQIEAGKRGLTLDVALQFAKAFDCSLDVVFGLLDPTTEEENSLFSMFNSLYSLGTTTKHYVDEENKTVYESDYITFSFDQNLYDLLRDTLEIYEYKAEKALSEDVFKTLIRDKIHKYNENIENGSDEKNIIEYALVPIHQLSNDYAVKILKDTE